MNQNDDYDRSIDEALRLAASAQPPAGYLERLQRRIETVPETHRVHGGLRLWIPAGCAAAAVFLAILLPALLPKPKPVTISAVPTRSFLHPRPESRPNLTSSKMQAHISAVSRSSIHRRKTKHAVTRDAANLFDYPLTHQEKLLVEFARTATPDELKELNPEYQAKVEAQQEAEFSAYLKSDEDSENNSMSSTGIEANSENKTTQE